MIPDISSFEAHITIEPVFGERFNQFETLSAAHKFKPAELLLMKQREATPIRSNKDSFCTGHSKTFDELQIRTLALVSDLKECGFDVWRYKIEGIVLDVKSPPLVQLNNQPK